jgi:inhibitor of cysteine peptidase
MYRGSINWVPGLIILLVTVFLVQCQSTDKRGDDTGPIVLTIEDSGRTVTLPWSKVVRITLESNPSTGYDWYVTDLDETMVEEPEKIQEEPSSAKRGAPIMETFVIKGKKPGQTHLKLAYFRVWEGADTAINHFEVTLILEP